MSDAERDVALADAKTRASFLFFFQNVRELGEHVTQNAEIRFGVVMHRRVRENEFARFNGGFLREAVGEEVPMLFSSLSSSFPETREEKFCLAASRATASASSMVSLTFFFFVFFSVFSFARALRNAYPMTPEPQQKSMTRFVLSLQIPFFNLAEEDGRTFRDLLQESNPKGTKS